MYKCFIQGKATNNNYKIGQTMCFIFIEIHIVTGDGTMMLTNAIYMTKKSEQLFFIYPSLVFCSKYIADV